MYRRMKKAGIQHEENKRFRYHEQSSFQENNEKMKVLIQKKENSQKWDIIYTFESLRVVRVTGVEPAASWTPSLKEASHRVTWESSQHHRLSPKSHCLCGFVSDEPRKAWKEAKERFYWKIGKVLEKVLDKCRKCTLLPIRNPPEIRRIFSWFITGNFMNIVAVLRKLYAD